MWGTKIGSKEVYRLVRGSIIVENEEGGIGIGGQK